MGGMVADSIDLCVCPQKDRRELAKLENGAPAVLFEARLFQLQKRFGHGVLSRREVWG